MVAIPYPFTIMNRSSIITLFHYGTGLMDAVTGLCLLFFPIWTLEMMKVTARPDDANLTSYIGVFVLTVGCSQFLAGKFPTDLISAERWKTIWKITSLVRFCVAFFVLSKVLSSEFDPAWISVTLTDFSVAMVFTIMLSLKKLDPQ